MGCMKTDQQKAVEHLGVAIEQLNAYADLMYPIDIVNSRAIRMVIHIIGTILMTERHRLTIPKKIDNSI